MGAPNAEFVNAEFAKLWNFIKAFRADYPLDAQMAEYNFDAFMMIRQRNGKL